MKMIGSNRSASLALLFAWLVACGEKTDGAGSTSSTTSATAGTTGTAAASVTASTKTEGSAQAATPPSASPSGAETAQPSGGEVDVASVMDDKPGETSSGITVDLSNVPDKAPALGGLEKPPPKAEWLPVGNLAVMNPGWEKKKKGELGMLYSKELDAAVVFTGYGAHENGGKKVDEMTKLFRWKETVWSKKPKAFLLGEDKSVPAYIFFGRAKDDEGKPLKVFFALMKTGKPVNVVALGGSSESSPPKAFKTALGIVALARRVK